MYSIHNSSEDKHNVHMNIIEPLVLCEQNDLLQENLKLKEQNAALLKKIEELEVHLKKYTNGDNHKRYYEKNKQKIKETGTAYLQKLKMENPDKLKEYSRNAYQRKKEKKRLEEEAKQNNII